MISPVSRLNYANFAFLYFGWILFSAGFGREGQTIQVTRPNLRGGSTRFEGPAASFDLARGAAMFVHSRSPLVASNRSIHIHAGSGPHVGSRPCPVIKKSPFLLLLFAIFPMLLANVLAAEPLLLSDHRRVGETTRIKMTLDVSGQMIPESTADDRSSADKEPPANAAANAAANANAAIDMTVKAQIAYSEKWLAAENPQRPLAAVRHYDLAQAQLAVGSQSVETDLGEENRLVAVDMSGEGLGIYSLNGHLSRWELELIDTPAKSMTIYGLLPERPVNRGDRWTPRDTALAQFLNVDGITLNECDCGLVDVKNRVAIIEISGSIVASVAGVATEIDVDGNYRYDLAWKRVNWCELHLTETRAGGLIHPAFKATSAVRVLISPLAASDPATARLSGVNLAGAVGPEQSLRFAGRGHGYTFLHDRRWHVSDDRTKSTTLRFVEDNDLVAQCHVAHLQPLPAGKRLGLEEYQAEIKQSLEQRFGQFESARQDERKDGYRILRVSTLGSVDDISVRWIYYHISAPDGQRAAYVFSSEVAKSDVLAESDRLLADSFQFTEKEPGVDSEPTVSKVSRGAGPSATSDSR